MYNNNNCAKLICLNADIIINANLFSKFIELVDVVSGVLIISSDLLDLCLVAPRGAQATDSSSNSVLCMLPPPSSSSYT